MHFEKSDLELDDFVTMPYIHNTAMTDKQQQQQLNDLTRYTKDIGNKVTKESGGRK